jgi:hypothetical protein
MAWIYLAESAESQSHLNRGFEQSPIVNETATLSPYYWQEWMMGACTERGSAPSAREAFMRLMGVA